MVILSADLCTLLLLLLAVQYADESLLEFPAPSPRSGANAAAADKPNPNPRTTMAVTSARPAVAFTYKDENQQNPWGREERAEPCHAAGTLSQVFCPSPSLLHPGITVPPFRS